MKPNSIFAVSLIIFLAQLAVCSSAQEISENAIEQDIGALTQALQSNDRLSSEEQTQVKEKIQQAEEFVRTAQALAKTVRGYQREASDAETLIAELKRRTQNVAEESVSNLEDLTEAELSRKLSLLLSQQESRLAQYADTQAKQAALSARSSAIADAVASHSEQLNASEAPAFETITATDSLNDQAKILVKKAKRYQLQSDIQSLEGEFATIPLRQSLYDAQASFLREQITRDDTRIAQMQGLLAKSRSAQATATLASTEKTLASLSEESYLRPIAQENVSLAMTLKRLLENDPVDYDNIAALQSQLTRVQQASKTIERVLATGRVSDELGELLRRLRAGLPKLEPLKQRLETIEKLSVQQQLNAIVWQDRLYGLTMKTGLNGLTNDDQNLARLAAEDKGAVILQQLVNQKTTIFERLIAVSNSQRELMLDESLVLRDVIQETSDLQARLDRRLLWLSSSTNIAGKVWSNLYASISWLSSAKSWAGVLSDFWAGVKKSPLVTLFFIFLPIALALLNPLLRASLRRLLARVGNVNNDTFWTTPLALVETFLLALPLPLLIGTLGGILAAGAEPSSFSKALAAGLAAASSVSLILMFFRSMCRRNGIFVGHFGWSESARGRLRKHLLWFVWLQAFSSFLFTLAIAADVLELRYGLGMFAFIASSIGITLFNYFFFRPKNGIASSIIEHTPASPLLKFSFPLFVATPFCIGALPLIGFFDTAVELQSKFFQSGIVLILTAVFYGILMRIFFVTYRRFTLKQLKDQHSKLEQAKADKQEATASGDAVPADTRAEQTEKDDVSRQARSIFLSVSALVFLVSLWLIWKTILPALGVIDDIVLWQRVRVVDGLEVTSAVTLWNIILSLLFITAGFVAARNIRGILEVGIFERLDLDPGARYAAITVLGYILVGTGLVVGFAQWGIDWSKLQWIVAALGVGLGFGLQEIVANFISGIIILFERPIRVGDTVTIGSLSGTVSNIKIRATTVTDFDNREVLLPNKSIITENVTNWTLNDAVTRIVLRIGVAYGSDIAAVRRILVDVLDANPDVLKEPQATVFFMSHGDSSLDFELRIFVGHPAKRLPVTNDINTAINEAFAAQGIQIPFPQRDLHIVSTLESKAVLQSSEEDID